MTTTQATWCLLPGSSSPLPIIDNCRIYNHMLEFLHRFSHSTSRRSKSDQIRKKGRNQSPSFPEQLYFEHSEEQMLQESENLTATLHTPEKLRRRQARRRTHET